MASYNFKYPGYTLGHPKAQPGWIRRGDGIPKTAFLRVTDVPEDVPPATVVTRVQNAMLTVGLDKESTPEHWTMKWDQIPALHSGGIVNHRRRADMTDLIQEACIARADAIGMSKPQLVQLLDGKVGQEHIYSFLGRRSSMGSSKLQHLLQALDRGDGLGWLADAIK